LSLFIPEIGGVKSNKNQTSKWLWAAFKSSIARLSGRNGNEVASNYQHSKKKS